MVPTPPLWKRFVVLLVPMMASNILQALSGTLNNIYLGQMAGVDALAAASAVFPLSFFFIAFVMGVSSGAMVLIGQAWGAGDSDRAKAVTGTTLSATVAAGIVIAIFGGIFARHLMLMLGTPANVLAEAVAYARVVLISMPILFLFLVSTVLLRGVGDTVTPLWALCLSTLTGLVVTPALIRGWAGLPMLGAASAAYAGVVAFVVALAWLTVRLRRRRHPLAPDAVLIRHLRIDGTILRTVLRIGLPSGVQMVIIALAEMVLLGLVNQFGSNATAAYGAVNQILAYVQFPAMSVAITVSILGAQAIGAGRLERLWPITRTGLLINILFTGVLVVIAYLLSHPILALFITNPEVVELAQQLLHIVLWSIVPFGMGGVLAGMMRASGTVIPPTAVSIFTITAVEVPVAWILSERIGVEGVWIAYPATFVTMLVLQAAYYTFVWRRKAIQRLV
ncbi:MAG TPA: MATE family efflux transporter [Vineibacter sp.]|nr:MATE family efflux transporter [Vineibacter sp.]